MAFEYKSEPAPRNFSHRRLLRAILPAVPDELGVLDDCQPVPEAWIAGSSPRDVEGAVNLFSERPIYSGLILWVLIQNPFTTESILSRSAVGCPGIGTTYSSSCSSVSVVSPFMNDSPTRRRPSSVSRCNSVSVTLDLEALLHKVDQLFSGVYVLLKFAIDPLHDVR